MRGLLLLFLFLSPLRAESDPYKKVAAELAQGLRRIENARVAVLAVPHHDKHVSDGPALVSEKLSAYLAGDKKFTIVERNHLVQILKELHLSESGTLDPKTTHRIGQALNANVIVTGTLINLNADETELNARALLIENGKVIAASRAVLPCTWRQKPRLGS